MSCRSSLSFAIRFPDYSASGLTSLYPTTEIFSLLYFCRAAGNSTGISMAETDNLSLAHLQAELARIDVLIQREVRRWQLAGQDPNDTFRGLRVSDDEALALLERPFGASWGATAELGAEQDAHEAAAADAQNRIDEIVALAEQQDTPLRLRHLVNTF